MTRRAIIQNGRVHELIPDSLSLPGEVEVVNVPDDVQPGYGYRDGKFIKPSKYGTLPGDDMHDALSNENYINAQLAKQQLLLSDRICVRCYEEAVLVPQEWIEYRSQLRTIISMENDTTSEPIPLPPRPEPPFPFVTVFEMGTA